MKIAISLLALGLGAGGAFIIGEQLPPQAIYFIYGAVAAGIVNIPVFIIALRILMRDREQNAEYRQQMRQPAAPPPGYGMPPMIMVDPRTMGMNGRQEAKGGIIPQGTFQTMAEFDQMDAWG